MYRYFSVLLLLILVFTFNLYSQNLTDVSIGKNDTVYSKILKDKRSIQIYLPSSYNSSDATYPLLLVTDGQWHFMHTAGIVSFMNGTHVVPNMIMVGIKHDDRFFDLTPEAKNDQYTGEADLFLEFLEEELLPYLESKYRVSNYKILFGTSLGGLFANYTLITKPDLFDAYIMADASLWWDNLRLIKDSENYFNSIDRLDKIIYFTQSQVPIMGNDRFARMLHKSAPKGLKWKFKHMRLETHASVSHRSIYDGLEFIYSGWSNEAVTTEPATSIFKEGDTLNVSLSHPKTLEIHYTLDGSEPNFDSPIYEIPIVITENRLLKTKPFFGYKMWGVTDSAKYEAAVLQKGESEITDLEAGLTYKYYEGNWNKLPKFSELTPKSSGITEKINLEKSESTDEFALLFEGYINIEHQGVYTFYLGSDDGSKLTIGSNDIILDDGIHEPVERSAQVLLAEGMHKIKVEYFEKGAGEFLAVEFEGSGIERQEFPASNLFHK